MEEKTITKILNAYDESWNEAYKTDVSKSATNSVEMNIKRIFTVKLMKL
jgi:hypothetical protein